MSILVRLVSLSSVCIYNWMLRAVFQKCRNTGLNRGPHHVAEKYE